MQHIKGENMGVDRIKCLVDSREKWTQKKSQDKHIRQYFDRHSIEYEVIKLECGDYMMEGNPIVSVDRKQSLEEVARNLMNRSDASRFWREVRRAKDLGIQLVILVESGPAVLSINDVPKWKSKYTQVTGRRLVDEMIRTEMAYGVRWAFCSKASTGKRIIEILEGK